MTGSSTRPIPKGFHTLTPHLVVKGAAEAVDFYKRAFGADELFMNKMADGTVMHAQMAIGDSVLMLADEFPDMGCRGPQGDQSPPVSLHVYVEDVDRSFETAVEAGAEVRMPVQNTFWGDRYGVVKDPFGHQWSIASRIEDLTAEEIAERAKTAFRG